MAFSGDEKYVPGAAYLIVVAGGDESNELGKRVEIGLAPMVIGRSSNCNLVVRDANVSRTHAEIRWRNGYVLCDLESSNGTRVNELIVHERRLTSGDTVRIGRTLFMFFQSSYFSDDDEHEARANAYLEVGLALQRAAAVAPHSRSARAPNAQQPNAQQPNAAPAARKHRDAIIQDLNVYSRQPARRPARVTIDDRRKSRPEASPPAGSAAAQPVARPAAKPAALPVATNSSSAHDATHAGASTSQHGSVNNHVNAHAERAPTTDDAVTTQVHNLPEVCTVDVPHAGVTQLAPNKASSPFQNELAPETLKLIDHAVRAAVHEALSAHRAHTLSAVESRQDEATAQTKSLREPSALSQHKAIVLAAVLSSAITASLCLAAAMALQ